TRSRIGERPRPRTLDPLKPHSNVDHLVAFIRGFDHESPMTSARTGQLRPGNHLPLSARRVGLSHYLWLISAMAMPTVPRGTWATTWPVGAVTQVGPSPMRDSSRCPVTSADASHIPVSWTRCVLIRLCRSCHRYALSQRIMFC